MSYGWLTALTASRLLVCVPLWIWCWRARPRGMVWIMTASALAFVATDFVDGGIARRNGLESRLGNVLDRAADVAGALAMVATLILGPREAAARRRRRPPA